MKKLLVLTLLICVAMVTQAAEPVIKLQKPNMNRSGSVMKAFAERQSTREFATKPLTIADLSDLLWAAYGVNRADGRRTAPSAMNRQDVSLYVVLPQGVYLYDAPKEQLTLVVEGDHRALLGAGQDFMNTAPLALLLITDLAKLGDPKNERTFAMGAADVGIVSQNISLFCAAAHLATVPRAMMDTAKLKTLLKLTDAQQPILNHPVGYFK
ncbi:MAG: SagB/ThcOx family dehydrogenase [Prevotellaceae bacterium]|nr:SagB/ThcOx family dehydrogenase [Prevotellaceae bacterium]